MAPVLLVLLRIIQGIGVGGEFGGATSLLAEFGAKRKSRAFWMSLANLGISLGLISASAVFLVLSKTFATTGWRIAMLLSAVIVIPALVARYKLADSPYLSNSSGGSSLPECRASVFLEARGSHPPPCHGLGVPVDGLGRERNIRHLLHAFCRHSLGDHSTHHFCEPGR